MFFHERNVAVLEVVVIVEQLHASIQHEREHASVAMTPRQGSALTRRGMAAHQGLVHVHPLPLDDPWPSSFAQAAWDSSSTNTINAVAMET
jgi:hypothetical protein